MLRLQSAFKIFGHSSGRSRNAQVLHHASLERRLWSGSTELPKNARNVPTNSRILPRFRLIERTSLDLLSENRGLQPSADSYVTHAERRRSHASVQIGRASCRGRVWSAGW